MTWAVVTPGGVLCGGCPHNGRGGVRAAGKHAAGGSWTRSSCWKEAGREHLQRAGVPAEHVEGCVVSDGGTVYTEVLDSGRT